jgi:NAD-dependent protein deacetylase/lipoamidase
VKDVNFPPELLEALGQTRRVTVLTGSGVSAESGVPTFRDSQTGLWARYKPEELATPQAYRRNPRLVWEWYAWRRELVQKAYPNPAHYALAQMERQVRQFTLLTQNVDGLHRDAGSHKVIELHGNIFRVKCSQEDQIVKYWQESGEIPPRCPYCNGPLRPDVVWFGEALPGGALEAAWRAAQNSEVFLSVGTSGLVQPAALLPITAKDHGALLVEINPNETPLTNQADYFLAGPAGVILPALVKTVWGEKVPTE